MKIGIITAPAVYPYQGDYTSYLKHEYLDWISQEADPVIIPYDICHTDLKIYLQHINGILWVGGAIENKKTHTQSQYIQLSKTLEYCYDYIREQNDQGNPFPIWATCLGYYYLVLLDKYRLKDHYFEHVQDAHKIGKRPLILYGKSKMRNALKGIILEEDAITHLHIHGFYMNYPLSKEIRIVATDLDDQNKKYITAIEYKHYPFYGSQFHPERTFNTLSRKVSKKLLKMFISECKQNKNHWKHGLKQKWDCVHIM